MAKLAAQWRELAKQFRIQAMEAIESETRDRMHARADTLEVCADELLAAWLASDE